MKYGKLNADNELELIQEFHDIAKQLHPDEAAKFIPIPDGVELWAVLSGDTWLSPKPSKYHVVQNKVWVEDAAKKAADESAEAAEELQRNSLKVIRQKTKAKAKLNDEEISSALEFIFSKIGA